MQPISPHQTHSLGLSVDTNTQTHRLNEGAKQTHTQVKSNRWRKNNKGGKSANDNLENKLVSVFITHQK